MKLVDYNDSEDEDDVESKYKRIRKVQHIEGNWATMVYLRSM